MTWRTDYIRNFCEKYQEFGEVLDEMRQELEVMAHATPQDEMFSDYSNRLYAVVMELAAIGGGLRAAVIGSQPLTTSRDNPC
ncbi:MAG: hypothetical protein ACREO8_03485 [Luteimonas sp.]